MKVFQRCNVKNNKGGEHRIAILLDEENKEAFEAIWNEETRDWNTDFDYNTVGIDSFDVAGLLDFDVVRNMGYVFVD